MNLFGKEIISSISFDQEDLLSSIMMLYSPAGFECDVTFNKGGFYKKGKIPRPKYCFDLNPLDKKTIKANYRNLPVMDSTFKSLIWDPPFVCGTHVHSEEYIMGKRYTMYNNIRALQNDYAEAIRELSRVIQGGGYLIVKCQDTVHGRKNYFNHILVHDICLNNNLRPIDLFVLLAKNRFNGYVNQNHARKYHSYFWVFKKEKLKNKKNIK